MILCSKQVFLNVLTQLMDITSLLNANYYILDASPKTGIPYSEPQPKLDEDGNITYDYMNDFVIDNYSQSISKYFVRYVDNLNPAPHMSLLQAGIRNDYSTPEEKYLDFLMQTPTQISVYQNIFQDSLQGNHLQILIMTDNTSIEMFGYILAGYLCNVFGADITYVDKAYRKNIKGQIEYRATPEMKANAEKFIRKLRDQILLVSFDQAVTQSQFGGGDMNIRQFLNPMNFEQLIHLYDLLFPKAPLRGSYTAEHIKNIIIGRVNTSMGTRSFFENMGIPWAAFDEAAGLYSPEEDFSDIS